MKRNLDERLRFMQLDAAARDDLRRVRPLIMQALPAALDKFYGQVRETPETRAFFRDEAAISSAKSRQLSHWEAISSGEFDDRYVNAVTTIGEIHARIGLEPRWYIGGYALLAEELVAQVIRARTPKSALGGRRAATNAMARELGALVKAIMLDMDLAITVYVEAAEAARLKAEAEVLGRERAAVVESVGAAMAALSSGDLTYRMPDNLPGEYYQLRADFNAALAELETAMNFIARSTTALRHGSDQIAGASDDLRRRSEQQAASLEETAATLDEITATVRASAEGAGKAAQAASSARAVAGRSSEVVQETVSAMSRIEDSSGKIGQIIGVIDEIAFQTNLLALNAGVEAARAGDAGRGFAVVASEVRALAQRSAGAAKEIKELISTASDEVARGVRLVGETGEVLTTIAREITEIDRLLSDIAVGAQEQAVGLGQVNTAVNHMDQVTQQNAAMVEEATAATAGLRHEVTDLAQLVSRFQTSAAEPLTPATSRLALVDLRDARSST